MFDFMSSTFSSMGDKIGQGAGALSDAMSDAKFNFNSAMDDVTGEWTRDKNKLSKESAFKTDFQLGKGNTDVYYKPATEFAGGAFSEDFNKRKLSSEQALSPYSQANLDLMKDGGEYVATTEFGGASPKKKDWTGLAEALKSIKLPEHGKVSSSHRAGGFNFDSKLYENPLLTREYNALYSAPLYVPPSMK